MDTFALFIMKEKVSFMVSVLFTEGHLVDELCYTERGFCILNLLRILLINTCQISLEVWPPFIEMIVSFFLCNILNQIDFQVLNHTSIITEANSLGQNHSVFISCYIQFSNIFVDDIFPNILRSRNLWLSFLVMPLF